MESKIIVALDGMNEQLASRLMHNLKGVVAGVKFNDALDQNASSVIRMAKNFDFLVMADPKLHDIPTTVANRMKNFVWMGADWVTVHASGGPRMLEAAVKATEGSSTKVLAVTVLTHLSMQECTEVYGELAYGKVKHFTSWAKDAGVWGAVSAPAEVPLIKKIGLAAITPGIRPAGAELHDQARISTPGGAIANGADYLVIGRPITEAPDPVKAVIEINNQVAAAQASTS